MANIKSSIKDIKRSRTRRDRNMAVRSKMRTYIKKFREAAAADDQAKKQEAYVAAQSAIDKAVSKGVLKRNTGSRYKSRLAAML